MQSVDENLIYQIPLRWLLSTAENLRNYLAKPLLLTTTKTQKS